jgi:Na+/H+-dicarboxylate symporter
MPLCVSVFKANRPITGMVYLFVLAHVCNVELNAATIVAYAAAGIVLSFASPGTPGAGVFTAAAPLLAAGIPMGAIVMVQAMDDLPDVFKTVTNVTADLASAAIVARGAGAA